MIKLDNEYYIEADSMQFILRRKYAPTKTVEGKKNKEYVIKDVGYFASIMTAINRYRKEQMLKWTAEERLTLQTFVDKMNEMDTALLKKLRRVGDIDESKNYESKNYESKN